MKYRDIINIIVTIIPVIIKYAGLLALKSRSLFLLDCTPIKLARILNITLTRLKLFFDIFS